MRGLRELGAEPVLPRVRQVKKAEIQPMNGLGSLFGQLGADRLGLLETRDLVAAETAVVRDQLFAGVDLLGV